MQMKDTKQYFPMVLFITHWKVVLTFESAAEILSVAIIIQMKASGQYFPVVRFNTMPAMWF